MQVLQSGHAVHEDVPDKVSVHFQYSYIMYLIE